MNTRDEKTAFKQYIFGRVFTATRPLDAKEAGRLISEAEEIKKKAALCPQAKIMDVFAGLSKAWSDPGYPKRREAQKTLRHDTALSEEFIRAVLDEFPRMLSPEHLLKKIELELGSETTQDGIRPKGASDFRLMIQPAGLVLHVASGNVFLGCIESLIDGIITRNVNFLKMSSADRSFPVIFAESLGEFDRENVVARRIALVWWPAGDRTIEDLFKTRMNRIIFWGGGEALSSWQRGIGQSTVLVAHGPKISFGVISKKGLDSSALTDVTDRIAFDIAVWEQRACNSPQMIFVEDGVSLEGMKALIDSLSESLRKIALDLPPAERSADECVELLKARELAVAKSIAEDAPVSVLGPASFDWTIIYDGSIEGMDAESSPLNRTIIIRHYKSLDTLSAAAAEYSAYLQTVGYCLGDSELEEYVVSLSRQGVTRICPFGLMAIPPVGAPHDGVYALRDLVRFAVVE